MSQMLAEISRIVTEDISNRVTQYDVLFEAITNSIHANATTIKCYLNSNDSQLTDDTKEIGSIRVDTIKIIDNGDGLTDENYKSFSKTSIVSFSRFSVSKLKSNFIVLCS